MTQNTTAAGSQPAAVSHADTAFASMNDYSTGSNPYAGPYFLARLLANLPVDEASLNGIGSPWEGLGKQLVPMPPENRLNQFEAVMAKEPYHEAIRQAIFSIDPLGSLPVPPDMPAVDFPSLPGGVHPAGSWRDYETGKWLKDYCRFSCQAAPMSDPAFHLSTGLFLLSTVVARRVYLQAGIHRIYPNLYQLIVAESTLYHKTTAIRIGETLLKQAGLDTFLLASRQTPESLVAELGTIRPSTFESWDTAEKKRWLDERAFSAQRGWLMDEASHLLDSFNRDYTAGLLPLVLSLFDCPDREVSQTVGRGRQTVKDAYLSYLGATTPSAVSSHIERSAHWSNGLWARFAMITPQKQIPDWRFFPNNIQIPQDLITRLVNLAKKALPVPKVKETAGDVQVETPQAVPVTLHSDVYAAWEAYAKALGYDMLLQGDIDRRLYPSYGRLYISAMKVAMLLAVSDWASRPDREEAPCVSLDHWYQGQSIAEIWRESVHRLLNEFSAGDERGQEDGLMRVLKRAGSNGMTAREIGLMIHQKREGVETLLLGLEQDGLVERVPNNGRRAITYRLAMKV